MRLLSRFAVASSAIALIASTASAQTNFTGYTNGCFYTTVVCAPATTNASQSVSIVANPNNQTRLTYQNANFNITSVGNTATFVPFNDDFLGTFQRGAGEAPPGFDLDPWNFLLRVTFTAPAGVGPAQTFSADVSGKLGWSDGTAFIDFGGAQTFAFNGGTFTLTVNDVTAGFGPAYTTGTIVIDNASAAVVTPEPSTYVLMAVGLAGLGFVARRRRTA